MQWELLATWAAIGVSVLGGVYKMGQFVKTVEDQQDQITELKEDIKAAKELPIKFAAIETDIKYLIQGMTEIKQFLMRKVGE